MAFTKNIKRKAEKKFLKISHAPNLQNHHSPNMKIHWHPEFFLLHWSTKAFHCFKIESTLSSNNVTSRAIRKIANPMVLNDFTTLSSVKW